MPADPLAPPLAERASLPQVAERLVGTVEKCAPSAAPEPEPAPAPQPAVAPAAAAAASSTPPVPAPVPETPPAEINSLAALAAAEGATIAELLELDEAELVQQLEIAHTRGTTGRLAVESFFRTHMDSPCSQEWGEAC